MLGVAMKRGDDLSVRECFPVKLLDHLPGVLVRGVVVEGDYFPVEGAGLAAAVVAPLQLVLLALADELDEVCAPLLVGGLAVVAVNVLGDVLSEEPVVLPFGGALLGVVEGAIPAAPGCPDAEGDKDAHLVIASETSESISSAWRMARSRASRAYGRPPSFSRRAIWLMFTPNFRTSKSSRSTF